MNGRPQADSGPKAATAHASPDKWGRTATPQPCLGGSRWSPSATKSAADLRSNHSLPSHLKVGEAGCQETTPGPEKAPSHPLSQRGSTPLWDHASCPKPWGKASSCAFRKMSWFAQPTISSACSVPAAQCPCSLFAAPTTEMGSCCGGHILGLVPGKETEVYATWPDQGLSATR